MPRVDQGVPVKSLHRGELDNQWVQDLDGFAVELLVTTFEDGTVQAAVRPVGWTNIRWSPPATLQAEPVIE